MCVSTNFMLNTQTTDKYDAHSEMSIYVNIITSQDTRNYARGISAQYTQFKLRKQQLQAEQKMTAPLHQCGEQCSSKSP